MGIKFPNTPKLIEDYLNTDFDNVVIVADEIDAVVTVANNINNLGDASVDIATMTQLLADTDAAKVAAELAETNSTASAVESADSAQISLGWAANASSNKVASVVAKEAAEAAAAAANISASNAASSAGSAASSVTTIAGMIPANIVDDVIAGTNVTIDKTDPTKPVVNVSDHTASGVVTVAAGTNVTVDATDPANPVVNVSDHTASGVTTIQGGTNVTVDNTDPASPVVNVSDHTASGVTSIVAGTNVSVDATDPAAPIVNVSDHTASGVTSLVAGTNVSIDATDPAAPIVNAAIANVMLDTVYDTDANGKVDNSEAINGLSSFDVQNDSKNAGIIIPMYIYPGNIYTNTDYNRVISIAQSNPSVSIHVILNPANGPGAVVDGNFTVAVKRLVAAGCIVYGYVSTDYSVIPYATVIADVDKWISFYPEINGIFFDEMSNVDTSINLDLYKSYDNYCKKTVQLRTIGNPGATVPANYFKQDTFDYIVIVESATYPLTSLFTGDYPDSYTELRKDKRASMVYNQGSFDRVSVLELIRYTQLIWVTPDGLPNPYGTLPDYLEELVQMCKDTAQSYIDVGTFIQNVTTDAEKLMTFIATRAFILPTSLIGSQAYCEVTTTATAVINILVNGVNKGTINFAVATSPATFTFAADVTVAVGDRVQLVAQATADATLADISVTLKGTL